MARYPITLALDRYDVTPRREVVDATIDKLLNAEARQHALMTGYAGPPTFIDCVSIQTGAATARVAGWIPPGVTYCDFGLRLFGSGDVTITTSADATGTKLITRGQTSSALSEHAEWAWTSGILSSSLGAGSGRAVQVLSTVAWVWSDVEITLTFSNVSTRCGVVGMAIAPILLPT